MPKVKDQQFECSTELKKSFQQLSDAWCRRNRLSLADLASRCGVSTQYLSHITRYGRIPSRPVLLLLALNLEVPDPSEFYRLANVDEPWPFELDLGLRRRSATEGGLLSINLDMNGFTQAIRDIVRAEVQPKGIDTLLAGRPLRVGLNRGQFFLFDKTESEGFITEIFRALGLAIHAAIEFIDVPHSNFAAELARGAIDVYGPLYQTPQRAGSGLFCSSLCRVSPALLRRVRDAANFKNLPAPVGLNQLRMKEYVVAVHADTMAHHFIEAELGVPKARILACELADEAIERILLTNLTRPAHLMLTDMPFARRALDAHPDTLELVTLDDDMSSCAFVNTLATRQDWPTLASVMNQALALMKSSGNISRIFTRTVPDAKELGVSLT